MSKVRVHELAKELGVSSKEVLAKLQELGEFVKSASSTVEAPVVRKLREAMPPAPAATEAPAAKKTAAKKTAAAPEAAAPAPVEAPAPAPVEAPAPVVEAPAPVRDGAACGPRCPCGRR